MRRNVYEMIYQRLSDIGVPVTITSGRPIEGMKSSSEGYMDLSYDHLGRRDETVKSVHFDIALAHYGKQNGDMMADPDMEIRIYPELKMAEALTFQNDYMGIYQEVYPEPGKYRPRLKKDLNKFLNQWLRNALDQGHNFNQQKAA